MCDLEKSIADWRRQMLTAGIKSPVPLEELEAHLREEIERQVKSGVNSQRALEIAAAKTGPASELKNEFKKIGTSMKIPQIIKMAGVIIVAAALICPLFVLLPCLQARELGLMTKMLALALYGATAAISVLSLKYNHEFLPVIHNQAFRRAVGMVCFGASLLWMRFGIFQFSPGGSHPRSLWLPLLVFGLEWVVMAILGGVGHGLEKAAGKNPRFLIC